MNILCSVGLYIFAGFSMIREFFYNYVNSLIYVIIGFFFFFNNYDPPLISALRVTSLLF
jgi:hypothetical protein